MLSNVYVIFQTERTTVVLMLIELDLYEVVEFVHTRNERVNVIERKYYAYQALVYHEHDILIKVYITEV